jgi:hypothetical protein
MAIGSNSGKGIAPCPICGNLTLLESCEPPGVAVCPACGYLWQGFRERLKEIGLTKPARVKILGLLIRDLEIEDSVDVLDLAFRLEELRLEQLQEAEINLEDLKEEDIQGLEELLGFDEVLRKEGQ